MFTPQLVSHYCSDTAKAQPRNWHGSAGLLCQQLVWDGAEPPQSDLEALQCAFY